MTSHRPRHSKSDLVEKARSGDTHAFAVLCETSRRRIWRVAASVTRRPSDADDLAQETILRAFRALPTYRAETSFEAWLCAIAVHAAHDHQKSAWRRRVLLGEKATEQVDKACPPPHEETERREVQRRVRAAVAALGSKERVPIWMLYFEGFTLAETARLANVPESTLRSRVQTGLKRLSRALGDLKPDFDDLSEAETSEAETTKAISSNHWKDCQI